jgi:serine/threonine protein kinase
VFLVYKKSTKGGKTNQKAYAMKVLKKDKILEQGQFEHTMTERAILAQVNSPFVVDMQFAFQTEDKLYLIMEFVSGGELFTYIQLQKEKTGNYLDEVAIAFYAAEIVVALEHIHSQNIVYRDLKPENILVDGEGHIKLSDFGLSKVTEAGEDLTFTVCGTPEYVAPEIVENEGHNKNIDWWSLGVLLFEMYTGQTPFHQMPIQTIFEKLKSPSNISLRRLRSASKEFQNLVQGLLSKDPEQRLGSSNGAADVMAHPFFNGLPWDVVRRRELCAPLKPTLTKKDDTRMFDVHYLN